MGLGGDDYPARAAALVEVSREMHARGWALATSSNFSSRAPFLAGEPIAITVSGRDKGALTVADVMIVNPDGAAVAPVGARPSAETRLHCQIYRRFPDVGAVLHVHAPASTVLSRAWPRGGTIRLQGYEMLKALAGVATHEHEERVPVLPNSQDIESLARAAEAAMDAEPALHGYLIAGHGLYTWGTDLGAARRHVEAFEFLFDCELRARSLR